MRLALMCGIDIPVPECQIIIHQPRIKEIALIGETDFFIGMQTLNINKTMIVQGETLLSDINNFQIFMTIMKEKEAADKKQAVKQVFPLILPSYQMIMSPQSIILNQPDGDSKIIDSDNFDAFQSVLKQIFCLNSSFMQTSSFNPQGEKAKEIAEKLMRARQRVAAQKGEGGGSMLAQYASTLTIGVPSMSLEDCLNLTMYQLFDLMERYALYLNWDLDIKSRLAGGKPESKPDNWMKNIH